MNTYKFQTNVDGESAIDKLKSHLDLEGVHHWDINTNIPEKILTILGDNVDPQEIVERVSRAGFKIEQTQNGWMSGLMRRAK